MVVEVSEVENKERECKDIIVGNAEYRIDHYEDDVDFFTLNWETDCNLSTAAVAMAEYLEAIYDGNLSEDDFVEEDGGVVYNDDVGNIRISASTAYSIISEILHDEIRDRYDEIDDGDSVGFFPDKHRKVQFSVYT